jgi:hypothetical protein
MSDALAAIADGQGNEVCEDGVWEAHAEALLVEMDGTTAELFAEAVRSREYAVLVGLATAYGRCISSSARAKTLEGIMSVCAVVPEGCEQLVVRSHATLDEVVKDACGSQVAAGSEEVMLDLYAVVFLGQVAEYFFEHTDQAVGESLTGAAVKGRAGGEWGGVDLGMQRVLAEGVARGLLARLDSDAPEMVLAAATALVTLNALAHLRSQVAKGATAVELKGEREVGWFWTQAKGHANMRFMGETVLQFLNRSDSIGEQRRLLIMTVDLLEAGGGDVIYSNDTHILADVCIRGLNESFGAKEEEDHSEGRHAQRLRDECRVLHVRVLEQLLLRPVFAADREACRKMAEVLLVLMDSSERDRQTERSLLPTGNIAQAAREAERVLSTHISVLDPPQ